MKFPYSITWFRYQVDWIERELGRKLKKKEVELLKLFYITKYNEKNIKRSNG